MPPATAADFQTILYVDDEPQARKWFTRAFGEEFTIVSVAGVDEALALLRESGSQVAVVVTDFRMPARDGMDLLRAVQREFRHLIRLLATAYADKALAIAAVNEGRVLGILEKPLDEPATASALREALAMYRAQALERVLNEGRVAATRETLGFLAHELNTPLMTVRGYVRAVAARYRPPQAGDATGLVQFEEDRPGEVLGALEAAERRALYCQSLVSTFVQSARDAYPGTAVQAVSAASLVQALLAEFPFEDNESSWVSSVIEADFMLPGRRDLLYLVLCTLTKNALLALRGRPSPALRIEVGGDGAAPTTQPQRARHWLRFVDNGPGIPAEVVAKLTREPVTTRAEAGGNGMGLMFCHRVMQSIGGAIDIQSVYGQGASMTLYFQPVHDATHAEGRA